MPNHLWVDQSKFELDTTLGAAEKSASWLDPKTDKLLKNSDLASTKILQMAQAGIPNQIRGKIYAKILKIDQMGEHEKSFELALKRVYGSNVPSVPLPPTFGGRTHRSRSALTKEGSNMVDHILCILAHDFPSLEYAPMVPILTTLMVHHMNSADDALAAMVAMTRQELNRDVLKSTGWFGSSSNSSKVKDWKYFPTFHKDSKYMSRAFGNQLAKINPKLHEHITQLHASQSEPIWSNWLTDFFVGTLPQSSIWRILDVYLVEGYKALFKIGLGIICSQKDQLVKFETLDAWLYSIGLAQKQSPISPSLPSPAATSPRSSDVTPPSASNVLNMDNIYPIAWTLKLFPTDIKKSVSNHETLDNISQNEEINQLNLKYQRGVPKLKELSIKDTANEMATEEKKKGESFLMKDELYWIAIWSWIPPSMRMSELELVFTSRDDGHHLSTLFLKSRGRKPMILLIESDKGDIFGAFLSGAWPEDDSNRGLFFGTGETFLFTLKPNAKLYSWVGRDEVTLPEDATEDAKEAAQKKRDFVTDRASHFILSTKTDITVGGGGDDVGLWINQDLSYGTTGRCFTFDNEPLAGGDKTFKILSVELFAFSE